MEAGYNYSVRNGWMATIRSLSLCHNVYYEFATTTTVGLVRSRIEDM